MDTIDNNSYYWFIFYNDQLLLQKADDMYTIPLAEEAPVAVVRALPVSMSDGTTAMAAFVEEPFAETDTYVWMGMRASYGKIANAFYEKAGKASEIVHWDKHSLYCPACGTRTVLATPISKRCPSCLYEIFPAISAAILVLIRKGDSILLVHARNFTGPFHSLVAGFLETGETLEQCVEREVMEETGLKVNHIRYWGNQPWPYPCSLMVGFVADYESGELNLQDEELSSGAFYTRDNLPQLPRTLSLARKMIDWWLEQG